MRRSPRDHPGSLTDEARPPRACLVPNSSSAPIGGSHDNTVKFKLPDELETIPDKMFGAWECLKETFAILDGQLYDDPTLPQLLGIKAISKVLKKGVAPKSTVTLDKLSATISICVAELLKFPQPLCRTSWEIHYPGAPYTWDLLCLLMKIVEEERAPEGLGPGAARQLLTTFVMRYYRRQCYWDQLDPSSEEWDTKEIDLDLFGPTYKLGK